MGMKWLRNKLIKEQNLDRKKVRMARLRDSDPTEFNRRLNRPKGNFLKEFSSRIFKARR